MLIIMWVVNALTLLIIAQVLPGFEFASFWSALITSLILGLVNATIRPLLLLITLPINFLTLGLFTFVINGLMILLVSSIVKGFSVDSFGTAFFAALLLWLISFISNAFAYARQPAR
jgi:putative membrane protein